MTLWLVSLLLGAAVTAVVALLLYAIWKEAERIEATAGKIWDGGTLIANNTVHVPDLARTNRLVERLLAQAPSLHGHLKRIRAHAERCPGCPQCVVGGKL